MPRRLPTEPQPLPEGVKRCIDCREVKPRQSFYRNCKAPDGRQANCRHCHRRRVRVGRLVSDLGLLSR